MRITEIAVFTEHILVMMDMLNLGKRVFPNPQ